MLRVVSRSRVLLQIHDGAMHVELRAHRRCNHWRGGGAAASLDVDQKKLVELLERFPLSWLDRAHKVFGESVALGLANWLLRQIEFGRTRCLIGIAGGEGSDERIGGM